MIKKTRRVLGILLLFAMLFSIAPATAVRVSAAGEPERETSKSKIVTQWDGDTAEITFSLPSVEEDLSTDIVFVMDASDCAESVIAEVYNLLTALRQAQEETNAHIKLGLVFFRGSAVAVQELEEVTSEHVAELQRKIEEWALNGASYEANVEAYMRQFDPDFINKGSNMHSGIRLAETMLSADDSVQENRKYLHH